MVCRMSLSAPERLRLQVSVTTMCDYETLHYEKDRLKASCKYVARPRPLGVAHSRVNRELSDDLIVYN